MRTVMLVVMLGMGVAGLSSCGVFRKTPVEEELTAEEREKAATQVIGEVASVYADEGFVLIRRYGGGDLPGGGVYNTVGAGGRTASVRPTGERSGRFHAADVTGGAVERGDTVVLRRLPEGSIPEVTPVREQTTTPFGME